MVLPVYFDNVRCSQGAITQSGLYRLVRASCPLREGLVRLWLCGGGRCVCLGVMLPQGDKLTFEKRFSRAASADWPERPEKLRAGTLPPNTAPPSPEAADKWTQNGLCLTKKEGNRTLVAIPARLRSPVKGVRTTEIDGEIYMLFNY